MNDANAQQAVLDAVETLPSDGSFDLVRGDVQEFSGLTSSSGGVAGRTPRSITSRQRRLQCVEAPPKGP